MPRSLVWCVLIALTLSAAAARSAEPATTTALPIYRLDLTRLNALDLADPAAAREAWDTLHAAASIQGIVNRQGANLFIRFMADTDDFWWDYLRTENGWLKDRPVIEIRDIEDLVRQFAPSLHGAVLYDDQVRATSNLASTIAGVEDRLALRYDPAPKSVYARLTKLREFPRDVLRLFHEDGSPLFSGRGQIPGTTLDSTGSAKNDAYLWAKARYLDQGKCGKDYLAFFIDSFWLTQPRAGGKLSNCTLTNHDFFIAHRAFFFDLGVWEDEVPVDDPTQKPGTDCATLVSILAAAQRLAEDKIVILGGFLPWGWKYVGPDGAFPGSGGKRHPVHCEWELARLVSAFNCAKDADALGYSGLVNASFYQHFPLQKHYAQKPKPSDEQSLKAAGYLLADAAVAPLSYVTWYVGDYDSGAWLNQMVPKFWNDPQHGKVELNWAFNPNLDRRVPQALHYARSKAAESDYFISGDNGAGYLNPSMLSAPRLDPKVADGWDAWTRHNSDYFRRYNLSVTGFIIDGFAKPMDARGWRHYAEFSRGGVGVQNAARPWGLFESRLPFSLVRDVGHESMTPEQSSRRIIEDTQPAGLQFRMLRTILNSPSWHAQVVEQVLKSAVGSRVRFVSAPVYFELIRRASIPLGDKASPLPQEGAKP